MNDSLILNCKKLIKGYKEGKLGYMKMPEDSAPDKFINQEEKLVYFTLPMSLNYQRNSYTLWESVLETYKENSSLFSIKNSASLNEEELRKVLTLHKIALQPNKHIQTWQKISKTINDNWGTLSNLLNVAEFDFLKLQNIIQKEYKKGFPYISGPKIFHYWCHILREYCDINLKNAEFIEIAPDTHIIKCSILLGVITENESLNLSRDAISQRWREKLKGSGITPIDMHSPLWFWSRNNFEFKL